MTDDNLPPTGRRCRGRLTDSRSERRSVGDWRTPANGVDLEGQGGRFFSGTVHGTVTPVNGPAGSASATCGSTASNPATSNYLETFGAKPT